MAGGKIEAYGDAPIGQARPRSAASAELLAAAGEAAVTEIHWKGALARAERAGKAPAHLESVLKLCALASLKRPRRSAAPPDGHSRPTPVQAATRGAMASRQEVTCGAPQRANPDRLGLGGGRRGLGRSAGGSWSPGGRASGREQPPAEHLWRRARTGWRETLPNLVLFRD